jgi:hypothetical protein
VGLQGAAQLDGHWRSTCKHAWIIKIITRQRDLITRDVTV